jgi:hypothetical protein
MSSLSWNRDTFHDIQAIGEAPLCKAPAPPGTDRWGKAEPWGWGVGGGGVGEWMGPRGL